MLLIGGVAPGAVYEPDDTFNMIKDELFSLLDRCEVKPLRKALGRIHHSCSSAIIYDYIIHRVRNGMLSIELGSLLKGLERYHFVIPSYTVLLLRSKGLMTDRLNAVLEFAMRSSREDKCPARDIAEYVSGCESKTKLINRYEPLYRRYAASLCVPIAIVSEEKARKFIRKLVDLYGVEWVFSELYLREYTLIPEWMRVPERLLLTLRPLKEYDRGKIQPPALRRLDYLIHCQDSQV